MRLGHIELFVSDPMASLRFYERVLGCEVIEIQGDGVCAWIKIGEIQILLRRGKPQVIAKEYRSAQSAIVLYTDNLEEDISTFVARGLKLAGTDGSDREPTFTDPDGHWFQIVDPRDFS